MALGEMDVSIRNSELEHNNDLKWDSLSVHCNYVQKDAEKKN